MKTSTASQKKNHVSKSDSQYRCMGHHNKTRNGNHEPKRNVEGVIKCRSQIDQQSTVFAARMCAVMQDEYNKKALFPEQYNLDF